MVNIFIKFVCNIKQNVSSVRPNQPFIYPVVASCHFSGRPLSLVFSTESHWTIRLLFKQEILVKGIPNFSAAFWIEFPCSNSLHTTSLTSLDNSLSFLPIPLSTSILPVIMQTKTTSHRMLWCHMTCFAKKIQKKVNSKLYTCTSYCVCLIICHVCDMLVRNDIKIQCTLLHNFPYILSIW